MTPKTILLLGATGTIGQAVLRAGTMAGHRIIAPERQELSDMPRLITGVDAVISCLASRDGMDAMAVDYGLNSDALQAAVAAGVGHFILLSAICVQRPKLAFQRAKLLFEEELQFAPLTWSIVRPTAFFKSLSGQVDRLRAGKPFLLFGDGTLTACKPISDDDLAQFILGCLNDPARHNSILPIGGPGPAITPRAQGDLLFAALGKTPAYKHVPVGMMTAIIGGLTTLGTIIPSLRKKAELARIGRYYATESMLVWDAAENRYDANQTPEYGSDTLADHYQKLAQGTAKSDRGDHTVF